VIVAGDEASLYLQATTRNVWHRRGHTPIIKLDPSRKHIHFYGGLDLQTGREVTMRSPVMTAEVSALFLHKLATAFPKQHILLLWDRAPWHRGKEIDAVLKAHPQLKILYLPTAAPDLNPQEQVWKSARGAVSHNHSQRKLDDLADEFEDFLNSNSFPCSLLDKYGYNKLCMMFK
jgi:transposase